MSEDPLTRRVGEVRRLADSLPGVVGRLRPVNDEDLEAAEQDPERAAEHAAAERARLRLQQLDERWKAITRKHFAIVSWADVSQPPEVLMEASAWRDRAFRFVAGTGDPPGNLILTGPTGPGKTFLALAMAKDLHYAGATVMFTPVVELLGRLRRGGREVPITPYTTPKVLILDDLGVEKPTDWVESTLYEIVNSRWLDDLPTIVTSNFDAVDPDDPKVRPLSDRVGERIWDRLRDGAVALSVDGPSRRRARAPG